MSSAISSRNTAHNSVKHGTATLSLKKSHANNSCTQLRQPQKAWTPNKWWLLSLPAFLIAFYAANFLLDLHRVGDSAIIDRIRSSLFGVSHIVGGLTTMLLGPFQFLSSVRRKYPKVHQCIGRVYNIGILIGGLNAFYVSFTSLCRPMGQYAFAFLGLIWLATAAMGMSMIWSGQIARHRNWMTRNFSLTYAAVMLRWQLPLFISLGLETEPALTLTGFTSWIPNIIFAEWWIKRQNTQPNV
jgi:uncharacterized membrane protein